MIAQAAALLTVLAIVVPAEFAHWREVIDTPDSVAINIDTTLPMLLIVVVPYFWCTQHWQGRVDIDGDRINAADRRSAVLLVHAAAVLVAKRCMVATS